RVRGRERDRVERSRGNRKEEEQARHVTPGRSRGEREKKRRFGELELHHDRCAGGVAGEVDATIEDSVRKRRERSERDATLVVIDRVRPGNPLVFPRETRGLADGVAQLSADPYERALSVVVHRFEVGLNEDVAGEGEVGD